MNRMIKVVLIYFLLSLISDVSFCGRRNRGHRRYRITRTTAATIPLATTTMATTITTTSPSPPGTESSADTSRERNGVTMIPYGNYTFSGNTNLTLGNDSLPSPHMVRPVVPDNSQVDWKARKDQERIMRKFMIQTEIIRRLGMDKEPNTTMLKILSPDQRRTMEIWYASTQTKEANQYFDTDNVYARHFQFVESACHPPRKSWVKFFGNRRNMRLFFPVEVELRQDVDRVSTVASANLHLYKKALPEPKCPPVSCSEGSSREGLSSRRQSKVTQTTRGVRRKRRRHTGQQRAAFNPEMNRARQFLSEVRRRLQRRRDIADDENEERSRPRFQADRRARYRDNEGRDDDEGDSFSTMDNNDVLIVSVYRYHKRRARMHLLSSQMVAKNFEGKMTFNISSTVATWIKEPRKNIGLEIRVENAHGQWVNPYTVFHLRNCSVNTTQIENATFDGGKSAFPLNLTMFNNSNSTEGSLPNFTQLFPRDDVSPMIYLETMERAPEEENSRRKRNAKYKSSCVREPLYVSFQDLGWHNWIVMPQGFETGYCVGTCSQVSVTKSYYRQQLECCGPTRLKPLKVLHYDEKGRRIGISVFDSFIVAECGCRR